MRLYWSGPSAPTSFRSSCTRVSSGMLVALLLLLSGNIERNPGPFRSPACKRTPTCVFNFSGLNIRSAVNKASLLHNIISDLNLDILALQETWIGTDTPPAIMADVAPEGFSSCHVHRESASRGGSVTLAYRRSLTVKPYTLIGDFKPTSFEMQLATFSSTSSPTVVANIYRPPSSSRACS